jgi:DNA-binding transcriptional MerR regulator
MDDGVVSGLLPIGRFARLCRLSVKQLRHYDELGLLPPARVDPDTGYRYYRPGQAREALTIGLLRSLDVPLAAIGQVLAGQDVTGVLAEVRDRLDADLARRRLALTTLDRVLSGGLPEVDVTVVRRPAQRVAVVREAATPERIGEVTSGCVARLLAVLAAGDRTPAGPLIGLFPLDLTDQIVVAVAAVTDADVPGAASEVLTGGLFACTTHVGPYDQIALTAHGLLAWCGERGHGPTGPLREVYLAHPGDSAPEQLVTQLLIPLQEEA